MDDSATDTKHNLTSGEGSTSHDNDNEYSNDYNYIMTERDFLSLLIDLYRRNPILWKVKHEFYTNKPKRMEALQNIVKELRQIKPDYSVFDLKKKINIIRTNFNKARHRMLKKGEGDEAYRQRLWYYNEMLFLADEPMVMSSVKSTPSRTAAPKIAKVNKVEIEEEPQDMEYEYEYDQNDQSSDTEQRTMDEAPKFLDIQLTQPEVRQKTFKNVTVQQHHSNKRNANADSDSDLEEYMTITTKYYKKKKTKEDILAKNWAMKLKTLSENQKIFAEKIINDVLYEGELGNLSKNGVSFCPSFP